MKQLPALFADWANGIFATVIAATIVGITEIPWWYFCIGILLSHLPDLDAVPELLRRGKIAASGEYVHDHREGLHYPIVFIVLGFIFIQLSAFWGWLFLIVTMLHFVNDSYGTGWGIKWLWPLTSRNFKFFNRRVNRYEWMLKRDGDWADLSLDERRIRTVMSWSKAELPTYISRWGHNDWIEVYYYRLNTVGVIEYGLFLGALLMLAYNLL